MDILDVLLDEDNHDPITLVDTDGRAIDFEQVAVIPFETKNGNRNLYCVLKPLNPIKGVADDEAIVFRVDLDEEGDFIIRVEEDESTAISVFEKYYDLLEENAKRGRG